MQPGFRSPWSRYVGGAGKPTGVLPVRPGDRSALFFWGGGAAKPLSRGDYAGPRSLLAFWMGGAAWHYVPSRERELIVGEGGLPFHKPGRYPIDDDECLEFLRLWVAWNDIE
jgi:hypothetical protein